MNYFSTNKSVNQAHKAVDWRPVVHGGLADRSRLELTRDPTARCYVAQKLTAAEANRREESPPVLSVDFVGRLDGDVRLAAVMWCRW
jgi:hypothetical protein